MPFTRDYLEPAVNLFVDAYREEKKQNPLLPDRAIREREHVFNGIETMIENPGVIVLENNRLAGYMLTGPQFTFKGQQAVLVPVYCHSSIPADKKDIYQRMYMYLADIWAKNGRHIHVISHFAHDVLLKETLFQLGFGAFLAERIRDFSTVSNADEIEITEEKDYKKLIDIQKEHLRYYPDSPIFISKEAELQDIESSLKAFSDAGDIFLVYYNNNVPCGLFILGALKIGIEGFLLQNTNTAQIKSAYARPEVRGKDIGKALLQRAIDWSREHGYDRLFVEHETANYYGGKFWNKHFSPYIYFSLRYIDNTINY